MTWPELVELAEFLFYRGGGFVVLNVLDEPALLALMFCCAMLAGGKR